MTSKELSSRLYSLAVFRGLLRDPVMEALARCVRDCADLSNWDALGSYGEFVSRLYRAGGDLGRHIQRAVEQDENVCIRAAGRGEALPEYLVRTAAEELRTLQAAAELTPETLALPLLRSDSEYLPWFGTTEVDLAALYRERLENVGRYGWGMYARHHMFYLDEGGHVVPVRHPDETRLTELVDYAGKLEEACFDTLNAGIMTKDLVGLVEPGFAARAVSSEEFLDAIAQRLAQKLA